MIKILNYIVRKVLTCFCVGTNWKIFVIISLCKEIRKNSKRSSIEILHVTLDREVVCAEDALRKIDTNRPLSTVRMDCFGNESMCVSVMELDAPWRRLQFNDISIPGMISSEEKQYYLYVSRFYSGKGAVVELGPWLGCSTFFIINGLLKNSNFSGRQVNVYDDFVWRSSWMDQHFMDERRPMNHADFQWVFEEFTAPVKEYIRIFKSKICDYDGNENIEKISWNGGPVEMMYVDCGRTFDVNKSWYDVFSPYFIPGQTLLIMQDWRVHRERPRKHYNQTDFFTEWLGSKVQLIHEVSDGALATFLYKG